MMAEDCGWEDMYGQAFRIAGCCAKCKVIYDITRHGFLCPSCASKNISWATREPLQPVDVAPYPHCLNAWGTNCRTDCPACQWVKEQKAIQPAVEWLERLYAKEDNR